MENISQNLQKTNRIKCEVRLSNEPYFMNVNIKFDDLKILERSNEFVRGIYYNNHLTIRINEEIKKYLN